jgi:curli production assembly/transport component CsgF
MKKLIVVLALMPALTPAAELVHQFNSPAFSGVGYSSHALTIYSQELSRKLAIAAEQKAELLKAEQDAKNTTQAKFIANLESRVYNELARQMTEKLFEGTGAQASGTFAFNGGTITYTKAGNNIAVTITGPDGSVTTMNVPIGDFGWLTP